MAIAAASSYEQAVAEHSWRVPERYNIAADVCDKHPPDKLAMIHEHFGGDVREVRWGELQAASNRYANVLRARFLVGHLALLWPRSGGTPREYVTRSPPEAPIRAGG